MVSGSERATGGGSDEPLDVTAAPSARAAPLAPTRIRGEAPVGLAATRTGSAAPQAARELARGAVIGRYVVLERLGAGAMGVVYSAFDPELDRKVALKLLRADPAGTATTSLEARARLVREAQALARVNHPAVVAIHDVGVHDDEVWIAMELVRGRTLREWLAERRRPWQGVLVAVTAAGRGVAAAHAAGLVHRDIKPDNVMIDDEGRVRVMDFGLARGEAGDESRRDTDERRPALAVEVTTVGSLIGTPAYMAPEQFAGAAVGPAADIFAFCVMLWEGLHGERPFVGATLVELQANVTAGRVVTPRAAGAVPRWLREVVGRGLATDPSRRWPSMATLLAALDRGQARMGRRRWWIAAGGVAVLAGGLLGARVTADRQAIAACDAEGAAVEADWSATVRADVERAFAATGKPQAAAVFAKTTPWLDRWAASWQAASTTACMQARDGGAWDDELVQGARACLEEERDRFVSLLAEFTAADATTLHRATPAAAGLRPVDRCLDPALLRERPPGAAQDRSVTRELHAQVARAAAHLATGEYRGGLEVARAAVTTARAAGLPAIVADAEHIAGVLESELGEHAAAEQTLMRGLAAAREARSQRAALPCITDLVWVVGDRQTRFAEAKAWAEAARLAIAVLPGDDRGAEAALSNNLGQVLHTAGASAEAVPLLERSLALWTDLHGEAHPLVAVALDNLGRACGGTGAYDQAIGHLERAHAIREATLGADHPDVAAGLVSLGRIYFRVGRFEDALRCDEQALAIRERVHDADHPEIVESLNKVAIAQRKLQGDDAALRTYDRALAILGRQAHGDPVLRGTILYNTAGLLVARKDHAGAEARFEEAITQLGAALGADHTKTSYPILGLGKLRAEQGRFDEAARLAGQALAIREKALGVDHPDVASCLAEIAAIEIRRGHPDAGLADYTRGLAIYEAKLGKDNVQLAQMLTGIAEAQLAAGRPAEALAPIERGLALTEKEKVYLGASAWLRFLLAQARWDLQRDRPAARALAERAAAELAGTVSADRVGQVDTWLAAHPGAADEALTGARRRPGAGDRAAAADAPPR